MTSHPPRVDLAGSRCAMRGCLSPWRFDMHVCTRAGDYQYIRAVPLVMATSSPSGAWDWRNGSADASYYNALSLAGKEDYAHLHGARVYHKVHEKVRSLAGLGKGE